jgi:hypothetical protein
LESHRERVIESGFNPQLLSIDRQRSTAPRNLITLVLNLDRVIVAMRRSSTWLKLAGPLQPASP